METNWVPGVLVLALGLGAAILFVLSAKKGRGATPKPTEDLEQRYQALLAALKEHAAAKHLLPAEAWQAEQTRLEQAAAQVLRARAGTEHELLKAKARAERLEKAQPAGNPALKGALVGALGWV